MALSSESAWEVLPFDAGSFTFAHDEPYRGEQGVVVAHALRNGNGEVFLFDTGIASGDPHIDSRHHPVERPLENALGGLGLGLSDVVAATNCHLHADHAGQNHRLRNIPIYVQAAERRLAQTPGYTIPRFVDGPAVRYVEINGDTDVLPGLRILATPGHSAGHQSLLVETRRGRVLLAGQAVYSLDEWLGRPGRAGRSRAPDVVSYDRSVARLRAIRPVRLHFAHDRRVWS